MVTVFANGPALIMPSIKQDVLGMVPKPILIWLSAADVTALEPMRIQLDRFPVSTSAKSPIRIFPLPVVSIDPVAHPRALFLEPVVRLYKQKLPKAVFSEPVVVLESALAPNPELEDPDVTAVRANSPTPVLAVPVKDKEKLPALLPKNEFNDPDPG